jgi:ABC-type branched-subunit amino acid transport system substrate-binding protein
MALLDRNDSGPARPDDSARAPAYLRPASSPWKFLAGLLVGALLAALAIYQVDPGDGTAGDNASDQYVTGGPSASGPGGSNGGGSSTGGGKSGGVRSVGGGAAGGSGGVASAGSEGGASATGAGGEKYECAAGRNGGDLGDGVTATKIKLAANVVTEGPGANFLGASPTGMQAVVQRVNNREGGICGRLLELKTVNDGWDANRGRQNIQDFIEADYFALPVMPSSEGLSAAITSGMIESAGIPVVGADGMRKEQYDAGGKASWIWPVAAATVTQVRVFADVAYKKGARKFGIVYDRKYKFGVEGADALGDYLKKLRGTSLERQPIEPGGNSYASEANDFKGKCDPCDAVIMLLEPITGVNWMTSAGEGGKGRLLTAGGQPLFNDTFATNCKELCDGIWVWTGYNPAIGTNTTRPGIARFISDVRAVNPSVDETNQFLQGAYLGMEVFVAALKACSPNLKRACVKAWLDSVNYPNDHTAALSWRPGNHFANSAARAYSLTYSQSNFSGFRQETEFVRDPTPGVVPS